MAPTTTTSGLLSIEQPGFYFNAPSGARVGCRDRDAGTILAWLTWYWHRRIEPVLTCYGWRSEETNADIPGGRSSKSNHLAGLALDINGRSHPYEVTWRGPGPYSDGLDEWQRARLRTAARWVTTDLRSIVQLGIDRPVGYRDAMHLQISGATWNREGIGQSVSEAEIRLAAQRLRAPVILTRRVLHLPSGQWDNEVEAAVTAVTTAATKPPSREQVRYLQALVGATVDGSWGPKSRAACTTTVDALRVAWRTPANTPTPTRRAFMTRLYHRIPVTL